MIDNTSLLDDLIKRRVIHICDNHIFHSIPEALPSDFSFDKIEGMLLGVAIGDSLGATTEGELPADRYLFHGEIRDYIPGKRSGNRTIGVPTDDTQMTFWTLKQLIHDNGLIPDNLAKCFCKHHIMGIGGTTKEFVANYKQKHIRWYMAGLDSLGNGSLMRISPIIVPYINNPHPSIYADAALDTMITHNSFGNIASCVAFISILYKLLSMKSLPQKEWWIETFCSVARDLEGDTQYRPRMANHNYYEGPLWQFTEKVVHEALNRGMSVLEACNWWGSGASLVETVPSVLYILANHADNAEEAIVRAVNDTKDNDTIAAIVGAAVGALHGVKGIPDCWIDKLSGRTKSDNDGEIFKLIINAKKAFGANK